MTKHLTKAGSAPAMRPEAWQRRQAEILDKAANLFAEYGYFDTDTQFLADELRVGKGTLYRYFPHKEDLFLAAVDRVIRQLHEQVDRAMAEAQDPLDRVRRAVRAHLAFFADHSRYVELLIQERAHFKDRRQSTYFQHRDAYAEQWRELYRGLIAAGDVRAIPIERIRAVITDLLYGTLFTNYFTGRRQDPAEQAEDILDVFFHGILSDRQRKQSEPGNSG
jgi:AcrR family transcriptional regulator